MGRHRCLEETTVAADHRPHQTTREDHGRPRPNVCFELVEDSLLDGDVVLSS